MDKLSYLSAVQEKIIGLPEEDIVRSLDYYIEMIDDRMEEGLTEEEAVAAMPSPEDAAAQILADVPLTSVIKARVMPERKLRAWEIVLLVLGSPVWLPLAATLAILILTAYVLIWVAAAVLWSLELSLAAVGAAGVVAFFTALFDGAVPRALFSLGCGLVGAGLAIFGWFVCLQASRGILRLGKEVIRGIKTRYIRKEAKDT